MFAVDDERRQYLALELVDFHVEIVFVSNFGLVVEERFELYLFEGELFLGEVGDHRFFHEAIVVHEHFGDGDKFVADGLEGHLKLIADLSVGL